jgi:AraC-like DNA-binding protein
MIDRALVYIRENAASGIGVDDVARHLNVSRRLLYLRFGELLGKTVLDVIAERRIELLKTRLSSSKEPIASMSLACGFKTANHAKRAFRAATGLTMRDWRRNPRA